MSRGLPADGHSKTMKVPTLAILLHLPYSSHININKYQLMRMGIPRASGVLLTVGSPRPIRLTEG